MSYKEELSEENLKQFLEDILTFKLNTEEIIEILNNNKLYNTCYCYEDSLFYNDFYLTEEIEQLEKQCFELVKQKGGFEGGGEEFFEVIKIKPLNTYFEHSGNYYSYAGIDITDKFYQVYPYQVLETHYSSTPK